MVNRVNQTLDPLAESRLEKRGTDRPAARRHRAWLEHHQTALLALALGLGILLMVLHWWGS
ncbi:MAG TPA: hypothetical protein VMK12_13880 [Anaeromyxobacteraceae bacterium]|nr:hypothetical protein [Anaeromyxobacteraceae bacterium]